MHKFQLLFQPLLLVSAPFCLALGLTLPLVRFERLYLFNETPSLFDIVVALWTSGDVVLAIIVGTVSVVLPILKLLVLSAEAVTPAAPGRQMLNRHLVPFLAKWSMMDVLIVALAIVAAKTSGLADAFTQPGLWFYLVSAISSGLLHALGERARGRIGKNNNL